MSPAFNGHLLTGRSTSTDRTLDPQRPVVSSNLPSMTGRVRSNAIGRSQRPVILQHLCHRTSARPDAACQRPVHSDPASGQLTDASIFATNLFSLLTSSPLHQCANHQEFASGIIENRRSIFSKAPNSRSKVTQTYVTSTLSNKGAPIYASKQKHKANKAY